MAEAFGTFDFGLTADQEERARRLHGESVIVDMLFQGPCGPRAYSEQMVEELKAQWEPYHDLARYRLFTIFQVPRLAAAGQLPAFKACWDASGLTGGNRQVATQHLESFAAATLQFDQLPWLRKALRVEDFRAAKAAGGHAGYLSTQNGHDGELQELEIAHAFGLRMLQLTYNQMNRIGTGCTERVDAGISAFGAAVIAKLNALGIIVDTGHCGRQTTLDACALSTQPVVASHTGAFGVYEHPRNKTDRELRALAETGGVIGIYACPFFLGPGAGTIELMLDHIDYTARLVGWQHVGIGTDWPLQMPTWALEGPLKTSLAAGGFRPEHAVVTTQNLIGFDDYRDYPNITRGLVRRGYTDEQIQAILGENFLRVFGQVCG